MCFPKKNYDSIKLTLKVGLTYVRLSDVVFSEKKNPCFNQKLGVFGISVSGRGLKLSRVPIRGSHR